MGETSSLYARFKKGRFMPWQCPSARPSVHRSVRRSFPYFFQHASVGGTTCRILSFIAMWLLWPLTYFMGKIGKLIFCNHGLINQQAKLSQSNFRQSWPQKLYRAIQIWFTRIEQVSWPVLVFVMIGQLLAFSWPQTLGRGVSRAPR